MVYRHLAAILVLGALALPARAADEDGPLDAKTAKAQLQEAFKTDSDAIVVEAIEQAADVDDAGVVNEIERAFKMKSPAVTEAALKALGASPSSRALTVLHQTYNRVKGKKLNGHEDLFALLLREIGRHGDTSSVKILIDKPFKHLTYDVGVARIMGLGCIRAPEAMDGLIHLTRQAGGRGGQGVASHLRGRFRSAFRTSMAVLTGTDQGEVPEDWDTWWRKHKKGFEFSPERPEVPEDVSMEWEGYWGVPYYADGDEPAPPSLRSPIRRIEDPSADQVKEAVSGLKAAFKTKDENTISSALETYGGVLDSKVVHEVAGGLRSRDRSVKLMAIEVLGWMRFKPALKQLHREFRRSKSKWDKDEDMFAELLQAIGRHGDKSSIDVLSDSPFKALTLATGRARILGLANIRDKGAIDEVIKATQLAGDNPPRSWKPMGDKRFVKEFEVALTILTGQEMGQDLEGWRQWWRKNKRTFKVDPQRPQIPDWMRKTWEDFWNEPYYLD